MKNAFIAALITLVKITLITTQTPTCANYDFNVPSTMNEFRPWYTVAGEPLPLILKSYNETLIPPFRSNSKHYLSATRIHSYLYFGTKQSFDINLSKVIFQMAVYFKANSTDLSSQLAIWVSNFNTKCSVQIIKSTNGWTILPNENDNFGPYYDIDEYECGGDLKNVQITIVTVLQPGAELAIEYLKFYDPEFTDENCISKSNATTTNPLTTGSSGYTSTDELTINTDELTENQATETTGTDESPTSTDEATINTDDLTENQPTETTGTDKSPTSTDEATINTDDLTENQPTETTDTDESPTSTDEATINTDDLTENQPTETTGTDESPTSTDEATINTDDLTENQPTETTGTDKSPTSTDEATINTDDLTENPVSNTDDPLDDSTMSVTSTIPGTNISECLNLDFNRPKSNLNDFQTCDKLYLPGLIIKAYEDSSLIPLRNTSLHYLSNRWEGLSCLQSLPLFSLDNFSVIIGAIYLNFQVPGAWINVYVVDAHTGDRQLVINCNYGSSEWQILSGQISRSFSNAQIVIQTNMNSYSALGVEYLNILNIVPN